MKYITSVFLLFVSIITFAQMSPKEVVQKQLDTYNSKDIEGFMSVFSDSAKIYSFGNPKPIATGKQEIRDLYSNMFQKSPELHSTLVNRIVMGNKVFDHESITGRNGSSEILELVMLYIVKNGLIEEAYSIRK